MCSAKTLTKFTLSSYINAFRESNCNSGDGTGQMAQPWMFMMMMMINAFDTVTIISNALICEIILCISKQCVGLYSCSNTL
jgi:hypothetical protein